MNVLALNAGSSSVKFRLFEARGNELATLARGGIAAADHGVAAASVLDQLPPRTTIDAVGHRVVHGGDRFTAPARIDSRILEAIHALDTLAPLHNAPSLAAIEACRARLGPAVPMVAVFDTAFHATLPARAATYALPMDLARRHGIRRFGFHGTSYRWVLERYCALTATPPARATIVALHLGSGCSAVAIRDGVSVDTSMGLTPLEGLMMATRSGDVDPTVVALLAEGEGTSAAEVIRWLNTRSGIRGIAGEADVRTVLASCAHDERARLAIEMFCYRARKCVGAFFAALGGAAAVVFTGGIGEHVPEIRARICAEMGWCGLVLDTGRNASALGVEAAIHARESARAAFVIPTDEETVIARDTVACLQRG